jgi:adenosylcobinamide-GDP ribazoletransferase
LIKAVGIAVSTYSVLPVPRFEWTGKSMRYSLCALPLVGLPVGALLLLWKLLCAYAGIGPALFAAVAAAIPVLITGGIHLDGFCDTVDALSSHRDKERKLEILKDSHVGAFAVIYAGVYLLLCYGLYAELSSTGALYAVCAGFTLSRALAVLTALTLPNARKGGMLAAFTDHLARRTAFFLTGFFLLAASGGMVALRAYAGGCGVLLAGLWFFWYRRLALRQFGGVTGDTTGFFLQIAELAVLLGAVLGTHAERML